MKDYQGKVIYYPHGLGDCILLTPAIQEIKKKYEKIILIVQKRFATADLRSIFGYDDKVEYIFCDDVWKHNCFDRDKKFYAILSSRLNYDYTVIWHDRSHKILYNNKQLGVPEDKVRTLVWSNDIHRRIADAILHYLSNHYSNDKFTKGQYIFVQYKAGVFTKDLPLDWIKKYIKRRFGDIPYLVVDETFPYDQFPLGVWFELQKRALCSIVPDSLYFHSACAMNLPIEVAYFAKGQEVWQRVRPLHEGVKIKHLCLSNRELESLLEEL